MPSKDFIFWFYFPILPISYIINLLYRIPIKISSYILEKRDLLLVTSLFFLFAVAIGFIITLSDWKVRDSIARNQFHRFIMVMIVFIFLTPIVYLINELFFLKSNWKYYVVFILGVLTLYLTSLIKIKSIKKP